jgi:hypothetical protein
MKKIFFAFIVLAFVSSFFASSCKSNSGNNEAKVFNNDTVNYFSISNFIKQQIDTVAKTPYYIYKLTLENNKRDSVQVLNTNFATVAKVFIDADINTPAIKKYYKEDIFHDLSTKSLTITYTSSNPALPVRSIAIMLNEEEQKVMRIDIRKVYNKADSTISESLTWKPNNSFSIAKVASKGNIDAPSVQTSVIWNDNR